MSVMPLERAMRPWRSAGLCLSLVGAAILVGALAIPGGGGDVEAGRAVLALGSCPFLLAGLTLFLLGLRRRPPA
jgi:hypothetical protein